MESTVKIRVAADTRAALKARGKKGESYDHVIQQLLSQSTEATGKGEPRT
jgi:hypothetical protein